MDGKYKRCPQCGTQNKAEARFCKQCGTKIEDIPATSTDTQAQAPARWQTGRTRSIESLGKRIDGWSDVVEDAGEKVEQIANIFRERLAERNMPEITLRQAELSTGGVMGKRRPYFLIHSRTGATVAVYIGKFGKNMYVSWDLFVRPVWNYIIFLAIIVLSMGLSVSLIGRSSTLWIPLTVAISIFITGLVAMAGLVLRRNPFAFFLREITFFDANDIGAMMLSVHKALQYAIDAAGLDVKLRMKEYFRTGRRGHIV